MPGPDVSTLLARLVDHTLASRGVSADQAKKANLLRFAVRLLDGYGKASNDGADESTLAQSIKQAMTAANALDGDATKVLELCTQLQRTSALSRRGRQALLCILRQMYRDAQAYDGAHFSKVASLPTMLGSAAREPAATAPAGAGSNMDSSQRYRSSSYPASLPSDGEASFGSLPHQKRAAPTASSWGENAADLVKEPHLVRDVLYNCQAVDGRFSAFSKTCSGSGVDGGYALRPGCSADPVQEGMVQRLSELGWLFRKVSDHVAASRHDPGAVRQALAAALAAELADFFRLLAVLETQSALSMPSPGGGTGETQHLTLTRLMVWLAEPMRRMRLLAVLADSTQGMRGGELAGAVYLHAQHGSPFMRQYVGRVLAQVCVPLFDMIRRWVFEGELAAQANREFFVVRKEAASNVGFANTAVAAAELWRDGYTLDEAVRPPFIGMPLALQILRAGKSINFLQQCCGDVQWVQDRAAAANAAVAATVSFGQVEALERLVQEASSQVDVRLVDIVLNKFQFVKHCDALRRYLLLGQGDFVQALMDLVHSDLDQEASKVSEISLNHSLRAAIGSTNARFDDEDVLERLRAKRDRPVGGGAERGWDVFSLQYDMRGPLAAVFTQSAMSRYLRVFQLLWRLKRVEGVLSQCWSTLQCEAQRAIQRFGGGGPREQAMGLSRKCLRLRGEMSHFVMNLQHYLNFEVLEGTYSELQRCLFDDGSSGGKASGGTPGGGGDVPLSRLDLDGVVAAHDRYLDTILRKALLDAASQDAARVLNELLVNMIGLAGVVNRFNEEVQTADRRLLEKRRRIDAGDWGTVQGEEAVAGVPPAELLAIAERVQEVDKQHDIKMAEFTKQLPAQTQDDVRFLLYRLDFTQFYRRTLEDDDDLGSP